MNTAAISPGSAHDAVPVTVVIVTYNSESVLPGCLDSLARGFGDVPYHVLVVDNASSDATVDQASGSDQSVRVVQMGRNAGYAAAINRGVEEAHPEASVLILNPDVRLHPGSVAAMLVTASVPGTGIAATEPGCSRTSGLRMRTDASG